MINYKILRINLIILLVINLPLFLPVLISSKSLNRYLKLGPKLEKVTLGKKIYSSFRDIVQFNEECFKKDNIYAVSPKKYSSCSHESIEFQTSLYFGEFGNRTNWDLDRTTKKPSLLIIGDSHAMGFGVNYEDTFSYYLASRNLNNLNLAVSGYSTFMELKRLEDFSRSNPNLYKDINTIVIQYCENDLNPNIFYQDKNNDLIVKDIEIYHNHMDNRSKKAKWKFGENNIYKDVNKTFSSINIFYKYQYDKFKSFFKLILSNFIKKYQSTPRNQRNHADPFFKVLERFPYLLEDKKIIILISSSWGNLNKTLENQFKKASKKYPIAKEIKVLDSNLGHLDYFIADEHLNKVGHEKLGILLLKMIN